MKLVALAAVLLAAAPAAARSPLLGPAAHYYGPLRNWHGVGFKESPRKDGSWRVHAESRPIDGHDVAANMALRRAAELARDSGQPFVQILGGTIGIGTGLANRGQETANLVARAAATDAAPTTCLRKRATASECFTRPVDALLATTAVALNLAPAAPVPGFVPAPRFAATPPLAMPPVRRVIVAAPPPTRPTLDERLKAAEPMRGHRSPQGWTISD